MEEDKYIGKSFVTSIMAVRQEDGSWRVKQNVIHGRSVDCEQWEDKHVEVTAFGKSLDNALTRAFVSINEYLNTIGYGLFNEKELNLTPPDEKEKLN